MKLPSDSRDGGGGGVNSAGRDLASLFDLELDTEKNQYETAQTTSPAEQHQKDVEEALAKLDALARRQQDLANQQHNPQQSFQERWQQEMLRREAEQLQRQMEQLAQNNQGQQLNGQQSSSGASSSGQAGSPQQSASSQSGSQTSRQQQAGSQSGAQNSDQRIEQALSRLRQAGEAMKHSGSPQQSADAARQAADQLREAANLLGGTQQQLASGKLNSLSHEADRLTQEQRAQSDRINKLAGKQGEADATDDAANGQMDRDRMLEQLRQRDQLAGERQQLSNDLSKLQSNLRDTAREMAPNLPGVSQKLRDALTEMDQTDLDNHVQRTADWLRSGINPNSNGTENEIAQGLQKLSQQLRQAQQALGQEKPGQRQGETGRNGGPQSGDETAMLNQVERLRSQLEAMSGGQPQSQNGQRGGRDPGGQPNYAPQQRAGGRSDQRQQDGLRRDGSKGGEAGDRSVLLSGDVRHGGGAVTDGTVLGNINTGANRYGQAIHRDVPTDASGNPADSERFYQQSVRELNQLRQMVQNDPRAAKEVRALTSEMQLLDPKRFPGNPEIVEQMHREVLGSLDRIELQLQYDNASTAARTGKPFSVPEGYQDSVAKYYKRLSRP